MKLSRRPLQWFRASSTRLWMPSLRPRGLRVSSPKCLRPCVVRAPRSIGTAACASTMTSPASSFRSQPVPMYSTPPASVTSSPRWAPALSAARPWTSPGTSHPSSPSSWPRTAPPAPGRAAPLPPRPGRRRLAGARSVAAVGLSPSCTTPSFRSSPAGPAANWRPSRCACARSAARARRRSSSASGRILRGRSPRHWASLASLTSSSPATCTSAGRSSADFRRSVGREAPACCSCPWRALQAVPTSLLQATSSSCTRCVLPPRSEPSPMKRRPSAAVDAGARRSPKCIAGASSHEAPWRRPSRRRIARSCGNTTSAVQTSPVAAQPLPVSPCSAPPPPVLPPPPALPPSPVLPALLPALPPALPALWALRSPWVLQPTLALPPLVLLPLALPRSWAGRGPCRRPPRRRS
mmetsp:Transcript_87400/g.280320  ORF Transcript_87400/g.280320 Transcript_87400/m.280320 type:complete len:409 (-) Transcript_87400:932-2158(-)